MRKIFALTFLLVLICSTSCEGDDNVEFIPADIIFAKDSTSYNEYLDTTFWRSFSSGKNIMTIEKWVEDIVSPGQGFDAYGNYLFGISDGMNRLTVSNLNSRSFVSSSSTELGFVPARHCNCQNFTAEYFLPEDDIPLLLVSGSESRRGEDLIGESYLMRIVWNGYEFKATLVQTITTVPGTYTDANGNQYPFSKYSNIIVDKKSGHLFVISSSGIYEMNLPPLYDNSGHIISQTNLTTDNIIRRIGFKYKTKWAQGACLHEGIAYIVDGVSHNNLQVIDITSGKVLAFIRMVDIGFDYELEDITFWKGHMIICGPSTCIYKVCWE